MIFSLDCASDLLAKCRKEIDELNQCSTHPEYDYALFNIVVGMNHLYEWYLKDREFSLERKLKCVETFNPYSSLRVVPSDLKKLDENLYAKCASFPKLDVNQVAIRGLCNKAKHCKTEPQEVQIKNYTSVVGAKHMQAGEPEAECGGFDHYIYIVEIDGIDENLEELVKTQLKKWLPFFRDV